MLRYRRAVRVAHEPTRWIVAMAQGKPLSAWQIEVIRTTWLLTENGAEAARRAGCSKAAADAYISKHREELQTLRSQKNPPIAEVIEAVLYRVLSVALDNKKLADASLQQVLTGVGILVDKLQLLSGEATERYEHRDLDAAREELARRIDELAARRRAKNPDLEPTGTG